MPRIREKRGQAVHELSVSPWMAKKGLKEGAEPVGNDVQAKATKQHMMYSVVLANASFKAPNRRIQTPWQQQQLQHELDKQQLSVQPVLQQQQQQLPACSSMVSTVPIPKQQPQVDAAPAQHAALGSGWHQVRRSCRTRAEPQHPQTTASQLQPELSVIQATPPPAAAAAADSSNTALLQPRTVADCTDQLQQQQAPLQDMLRQSIAHEEPTSVQRPAGHYDAWLDLLPDAVDNSSRRQQQQQQYCNSVLKGVAQLVLHPSGSISGHFLANNSSSSAAEVVQQQLQQQLHCPSAECYSLQLQQQQRQQQRPLCLGLEGRQVLGVHSCYRDPEWALLQLSVIKYSSSSSSGGGSGGGGSSSSNPAKRPRGNSSGSDSDGISAAAGQQPAAELVRVASLGKRWCRQQRHDHGCPWQQQPQQQQRQPQQKQDKTPPAAAAAVAAAEAVLVDDVDTARDTRQQQQQPQLETAAAAVMCNKDAAEFQGEAWVQRTGGDFVTLQPADMEDEDTAAAILKATLGLEPDFIQVHFTPHTLLAGAAAHQQLAKTWPGVIATGRDVVLNLGEMTIQNLPLGMLDD